MMLPLVLVPHPNLRKKKVILTTKTSRGHTAEIPIPACAAQSSAVRGRNELQQIKDSLNLNWNKNILPQKRLLFQSCRSATPGRFVGKTTDQDQRRQQQQHPGCAKH